MLITNKTAAGVLCCAVFALVLGLTGCSNRSQEKSNFSSFRETKTFSQSKIALNLVKPPPTPESSTFSAPLTVEEVKSDLNVSSLKNIAVVVTPRDRDVKIESLELAIFENNKRVYSVPLKSVKNTDTFSALESSDSKATGYLFTLNPETLNEGDRYFVAGNTVRLITKITRDSGVNATFYLVNKDSEVTK